MNKTYQPEVINLSNKIMKSLEEDGFFEEYQIQDTKPARIVLCDSLTEKFIDGDLNEGCVIYNDDEFEKVLNLMVTCCILESLKNKGMIDSFPDENGEEVYFATEKGNTYYKYINEKQ